MVIHDDRLYLSPGRWNLYWLTLPQLEPVGFSVLRAAQRQSLPEGGAPALLQDIECRIMIAVQLTTTIRAGVPANGKPFGNTLATLRAHLRRSFWIHFHHDAPGTCSLDDQDAQEDPPSGVGDRLRKRMVFQHSPNIQFLDRDMIV